MSKIAEVTGLKIRSFRKQLGYSQEKLAELAEVHPTYIGRVERGEKNASIESIERIANALDVPMSQLFESPKDINFEIKNIPLKCYEYLMTKSVAEQEQIYKLILEIDRYKDIK